jgi:hypothetical protein
MRIRLLYALVIAAALGAYLSPPIAQDPGYHRFADQRALAGIPHFWNVVSNTPFLLVGAFGLNAWRKSGWSHSEDRWPWLAATLAAFLIGGGSSYYHARPDDRTLYWDRLPMTLGFMAVFTAVIAERVHQPAGWRMFGPLLALGFISVEVWRRTGDLRLYALVQFFPILAIPLILSLFPGRYSASRRLWQMIAWYAVAKALEAFDLPIYESLGIGGHSLKHLAAAIALWMPLRMLRERTALVPSRNGCRSSFAASLSLRPPRSISRT